MTKKFVSIALVVVMVMALFAACGGPAIPETSTSAGQPANGQSVSPANSDAAPADAKPIKVAAMPYLVSMPVYYAKETGLDKKFGLDMEILSFANGATMNEAMASNQFDVAPIGGAGIFGAANFDGVYIADFQYLHGGDEVYAQKDHPATKVKGSNPTYPNILGDAESVKGSTILYTSGTTSQMLTIRWLTALGLKPEDVKMLNMDFAQTLQAFQAGESDFASMCSPYITVAKNEGYVCMADLKGLDMVSVHSTIASREAYNNKKDELARFVNMIYEANKQLVDDFDLQCEWAKKWYSANGTEFSDDEIKAECEIKEFVTWDSKDKVEYGKYHKEYAEFFVTIEQMTADQVDTVTKNTVKDILELAASQK